MDFVSTLNLNVVILDQNGEDENGVEIVKKLPTFSRLDVMYSKSSRSVKMDNFPGKISLILPFWFLRNVEYFETSTKFGFSTSDDLKTASCVATTIFSTI